MSCERSVLLHLLPSLSDKKWWYVQFINEQFLNVFSFLHSSTLQNTSTLQNIWLHEEMRIKLKVYFLFLVNNKKCPPPVTVTGPPDLCKIINLIYFIHIHIHMYTKSENNLWPYLYVFRHLLGAPKGFCDGKMDRKFSAPNDKTKFFFCTHYHPTACQLCPAGLVFNEPCQTCIREGEGK